MNQYLVILSTAMDDIPLRLFATLEEARECIDRNDAEAYRDAFASLALVDVMERGYAEPIAWSIATYTNGALTAWESIKFVDG